jgi:hypothetical protein
MRMGQLPASDQGDVMAPLCRGADSGSLLDGPVQWPMPATSHKDSIAA